MSYFKTLNQCKPLLNAYLNLLSKFKKASIINRGSIRWITCIEDKKEEDIDLINKFLDMGIEIRHINHLPPLNFAVSEKQFVGTVEKIVNGEMFGKLVHSTESLFVRHFQSIFEDL